jgi:hypothetical protein
MGFIANDSKYLYLYFQHHLCMSSLNGNKIMSEKETFIFRRKNKSKIILIHPNSSLQKHKKNKKEKQNPKQYRFLNIYKMNEKIKEDISRITIIYFHAALKQFLIK